MLFSLLETRFLRLAGQGICSAVILVSLFVLPSDVPLIADGVSLFGSKSRQPEGPHQN